MFTKERKKPNKVRENRPKGSTDQKENRRKRARGNRPRPQTPKGAAPASSSGLKSRLASGELFGNKKFRLASGTFVCLFAVFLFAAFVSHLLYSGAADQSALERGSDQLSENNGGYFGAWFASFFITRGYGIVAMLLPPYLFMAGYSIVKSRWQARVKELFPYMLFTLHWTSVTLAFIRMVFELPYMDLGGGLGQSINEWIFVYIGPVGTGLFLVFALLVFVNYKANPRYKLLNLFGTLLSKYDATLAPNIKFDDNEAPPPAEDEREAADDSSFAAPEAFEKPENQSRNSEDEADEDFYVELKTRAPEAPEAPEAETASEAEAVAEPDDDLLIEVAPAKNRAPEPEPEHNIPANNDDQPKPEDVLKKDPQPVAEEYAEKEAEDDFEIDVIDARSRKEAEIEDLHPEQAPRGGEFRAPLPRESNYEDLTSESAVEKAAEPPAFHLINNRRKDENEFEAAGYADAETDELLLLGEDKSGISFAFSAEDMPDVYGGKVAENVAEVDRDRYVKIVKDEDQETLEEEDEVGDWALYDPTKDLSDFQYPTIDLLKRHERSDAEKVVDAQEVQQNKQQIIDTLRNYGIEIKTIKATIGPTVTLYEIVPAPGVRISKIKNLEDDIALSLAALGIRIIAPMPGKGTIGIEIPNSSPEIVSFRSVIATEKFRDTEAVLPVAIGRTIANEIFIADLTKMPHLLIAGATGQGKSVGLNCLIASILYKKHPSQVKFVLIDPKKVELNLFAALEKHYLAKLPNLDDAIITENDQVIHVLNSLCSEMDNRYRLLQEARVRHITEYNEKFVNRRLNPEKGHQFMPYVVLIIDELADLMFTAGKEIETPIARLAQLARAVGIHLVLATQRPSVNVITGLIKSNFPARMSYRVTQKTDSRTILDVNGADQLIGRGDLLLSINNEIVRIQNAFINTGEVEKVVDFIAAQRGYPEPYYLPEAEMEDESGGGLSDAERDDRLEEAARLLVNLQTGSTSAIQQHLAIGYNRAARIMIQLEKMGIVGKPSGSNKPREILVKSEMDLERYLDF